MGARLYDAKIGRFLSRDPLAELFPNHSSYSYAYNSPLNFNDPTGLAPETEKGDKLQGQMLEFDKRSELVEGLVKYDIGSHWYRSTKRITFSDIDHGGSRLGGGGSSGSGGGWMFKGMMDGAAEEYASRMAGMRERDQTTNQAVNALGNSKDRGPTISDARVESGKGSSPYGTSGDSGGGDHLLEGNQPDAKQARVNVDEGFSDALEGAYTVYLEEGGGSTPDITIDPEMGLILNGAGMVTNTMDGLINYGLSSQIAQKTLDKGSQMLLRSARIGGIVGSLVGLGVIATNAQQNGWQVSHTIETGITAGIGYLTVINPALGVSVGVMYFVADVVCQSVYNRSLSQIMVETFGGFNSHSRSSSTLSRPFAVQDNTFVKQLYPYNP